MIYPSILTLEVAAEICRRSAEGEGVLAVIEDMKLPAATLDWLQEFHSQSIREAKAQQIKAKEEQAIKEKEQANAAAEPTAE